MNEQDKQNLQESSATVSPGYLEVIGIVLVIVLMTLFAYDRFLVPKVKVADLKGYLQQQKTLLAAGTITEDHGNEISTPWNRCSRNNLLTT